MYLSYSLKPYGSELNQRENKRRRDAKESYVMTALVLLSLHLARYTLTVYTVQIGGFLLHCSII